MALLHSAAPYLAAFIAGSLALLVLKRRNRRSLPLPPGPRPLPLIGNLLDVPREKEWLTYQAWHAQYGDVVYIEALGQKIVVLGSAAAVTELMEQRGAIYSDRPTTPMSQLMQMDWSFVILPYSDLWRRKRKLMHAHVHAGVATRYHPVQVHSARRFALDILAGEKTEEALPSAVCLYVGRTIIKAVYGIDVKDEEDEFVRYPEAVVHNFNIVVMPGRFMIDFFPFLKYVPAWFPGAGFQRFAQEHLVTQRRAIDRPIAVVKAQMADGSAPPSMTRMMLEEDAARPPAQSQLGIIKDVASLTYLAGAHTTTSAVRMFFLAMLVHPDVQAKAQAEVDRVVGLDRLPEVEDRERLPYVEAVVNECLRWIPVVPIGVPHRAMQDDEYKGYFIPKGALVLGSAWSILHNPEDYPEPERFLPERYLTPDGTLDPSVRDPRTACFGYGRRICPGRFIADTTLFVTAATLLATVDIVRATDAAGVEIVPNLDVAPGIISHARPFPWSARPRSRNAETLLANATSSP